MPPIGHVTAAEATASCNHGNAGVSAEVQGPIRRMVQEHQKTIDKFKHEIATTHDPTLKQFAQGTLPVLQSHLSEAQQIQSKLSGGK